MSSARHGAREACPAIGTVMGLSGAGSHVPWLFRRARSHVCAGVTKPARCGSSHAIRKSTALHTCQARSAIVAGVLGQVRVRSVADERSARIWTERAIGTSVHPVSASAGEQVSVYEAAGGAPAMLALAHAWHHRCLADPEAQHPFSHPGLHPLHTERLAAYWGEMLGGPDAYSRELASVAYVVRIHSGNGPHPELDAATERCFALALDDADIPVDERLRSTLVDWFAWSNRVVNHTYKRPEFVPDDLTLPHWSWDGPVE
jgi:hemoglobin